MVNIFKDTVLKGNGNDMLKLIPNLNINLELSTIELQLVCTGISYFEKLTDRVGQCSRIIYSMKYFI